MSGRPHHIIVISNSAVNIVELVHVAKIKPHRSVINKYNITAVATQNTVKRTQLKVHNVKYHHMGALATCCHIADDMPNKLSPSLNAGLCLHLQIQIFSLTNLKPTNLSKYLN